MTAEMLGTAILVFGMLAGGVIAVRNELVYRVRIDAIDRISYLVKTGIDAGENWLDLYQILDKPSYAAMIFDLTRWRFKDFYPELDNVRLPADTPAQKR